MKRIAIKTKRQPVYLRKALPQHSSKLSIKFTKFRKWVQKNVYKHKRRFRSQKKQVYFVKFLKVNPLRLLVHRTKLIKHKVIKYGSPANPKRLLIRCGALTKKVIRYIIVNNPKKYVKS